MWSLVRWQAARRGRGRLEGLPSVKAPPGPPGVLVSEVLGGVDGPFVLVADSWVRHGSGPI